MKTYPSLCLHPKEHWITLKRWLVPYTSNRPDRKVSTWVEPEERTVSCLATGSGATGTTWMRMYRCPGCDREWIAWEDAGGEDI